MGFVENGGTLIFFEEEGAGLPVVLGHSLLCSGLMWRGQVPALAARFRVLNLDFRGHGRSGKVRGAFSLYDAVSDAVAVLDQLGIDEAVWCGLSVGGMVALRAALSCPERVAGLILLDTDAGTEAALRKLRYNTMGLAARLVGIGPLLSPISQLMFGATTRRRNPALVNEWKREISAVDLRSILRGLDAVIERDSLLERLHQINVPALVLVGEEDRTLPPSLSHRIHDRLAESSFLQIPAAGHLSALEQPAAVTRAIMEFLETRLH